MNELLIRSRINRIEDPNIKLLVTECFNKIPPYWFMKPSSSTGKYHPKDEHLPGGLSLHTARVLDITEILIESFKNVCNPDVMRAGALLHDIGRYGTDEKASEHSLKNHAILGANWVEKIGIGLGTPEKDLLEICGIIRTHMGRWSEPSPDSGDEVMVHIADMVAAGYIPVKGDRLE